MNIPQLIHLDVSRFWDCFLFGATTTEADVNIHVHIFEWTCALVFLGKIPRSGKNGSYGT